MTSATLHSLSSILTPLSFLAHAGHPHPAPNPWTDWPFEPGVLLPLALSAALYYAGLASLWRRSGLGHGIRPWHAASFTLGWLALFLALATPLHPLGSFLFSAHMAQHEILMLVAAPLLVLGKPLIATLHALPTSWSRRLAPLLFPSPHPLISPSPHLLFLWRQFLHFFTHPVVAWLVHGIVLWLWHAPALFQATLHNDFIHSLQHLSFLGTALLFWYAVSQHRRRALGYGMAVLYMFTTALHSGALLTFTGTLWYPDYAHTTQRFGLTPLQDQQLGGLIMWIPACSIYILAGLALLAAYLNESNRRLDRSTLTHGHSQGFSSAPAPATDFAGK
jgi:putative membrane protein